ncbi:multiple sugar transport system substrate-binding protein [Actinocorallia herbida]|uniref:Multiple sugar transport system substrate-binding protein n=1 Tax=Actinocorallia herbida TaxID=58109 RepID=A0A3N1DAL9_9ACTN|nr:extracellular solute-binding protein [Actinocorallia herbida]ROO90539.1 multiple sugar transport system substrate-binding protein [Actinocorallia herbida]
MRSHDGPSPARSLSRRGVLGLGAQALAGAALAGCAKPARHNGELTVMTHANEFDEAARKEAERVLGVRVRRLDPDLTRLTAMLAEGGPPDVIRGSGTIDAPFLAASRLALDLDPHLTASKAIDAADLDPVGDAWRFDGVRQGAGPRYGLVKDYSQDGMFWCDASLFDRAGVALPDPSRPLGHDAWLDLARDLTVRSGGRTTTYGLDVSGLGGFLHLMGMTASAGGRIFGDDLATVDFSAPEPREVLRWYLAYIRARTGFSPVDLNPDGWPWPAFQARRMAMVMAGYWLGALIADEPALPADARLMPAPSFGGPRVSPCYAAAGLWIPRTCPIPETAWAFFEWYFAGAPARDRADRGFGVPPLTSLRSRLPAAEPFQTRALEVQRAELPHLTVLSFTPYAREEALDAVINRVVPEAFARDASPGALAELLTTEINEVLARGRERVG